MEGLKEPVHTPSPSLSDNERTLPESSEILISTLVADAGSIIALNETDVPLQITLSVTSLLYNIGQTGMLTGGFPASTPSQVSPVASYVKLPSQGAVPVYPGSFIVKLLSWSKVIATALLPKIEASCATETKISPSALPLPSQRTELASKLASKIQTSVKPTGGSPAP